MTTNVFLQATVNLILVLSSILLGCLPKKFKYSRSHDHNPPQIHVKKIYQMFRCIRVDFFSCFDSMNN